MLLSGTFQYCLTVDVVQFEVIMGDVNKDVNSFWSGFAKVLSERGIDDEHVRFYLDWVRKFAMSQKSALRTRSLADIRAFVAELAGSGVADWRINQARQAIAILYRDYLNEETGRLDVTGLDQQESALRLRRARPAGAATAEPIGGHPNPEWMLDPMTSVMDEVNTDKCHAGGKHGMFGA
jgi:hypothetical protein